MIINYKDNEIRYDKEKDLYYLKGNEYLTLAYAMGVVDDMRKKVIDTPVYLNVDEEYSTLPVEGKIIDVDGTEALIEPDDKDISFLKGWYSGNHYRIQTKKIKLFLNK